MITQIIAVEDMIEATRLMQRIYAEPIKGELIGKRIAEIHGAGVPAAGSLSLEHPGVRRCRGGRGCGLHRHPGNDRVGRARLVRPHAAQPQSSSTGSTCR